MHGGFALMLREFEKCCHDRIAIGPLSDNPQLLPSPVLSSSQPALVLQPVGPCCLDRLPMCSGQAGTASTWKNWMISASSLWNIICIQLPKDGMLKGHVEGMFWYGKVGISLLKKVFLRCFSFWTRWGWNAGHCQHCGDGDGCWTLDLVFMILVPTWKAISGQC